MIFFKCKNCGEQLDAPESMQNDCLQCSSCGELSRVPVPPQENHSSKASSYDSELLGSLLLIVPAVSIFLLFFWIGDMALIDRPGFYFNIIMAGTVILTGGLALMEALNLGIGKNKTGKRETGPVGWFFCFLLLWLIAYPAYLYKRSRYGLRNYCVGGVLIALVFIVAFYVVGTAINESVQEFNDKLQEIQNMFK